MIDFASLNISVPSNAKTGDVKTKCPECTPTRKNKSDPSLSVNVETGLFMCHNCGWAGTAEKSEKRREIRP